MARIRTYLSVRRAALLLAAVAAFAALALGAAACGSPGLDPVALRSGMVEQWQREGAAFEDARAEFRLNQIEEELQAQRLVLAWLLTDADSYSAHSQAQDSWARYAADNPVYADPVVWAECTDPALREQLLAERSLSRLWGGIECDVPEDWASR